MKVKYFAGTDTLHIEFRAAGIVETRDLDENTQLDFDLDLDGHICALTMEHASEHRCAGIFLRASGELAAAQLIDVSVDSAAVDEQGRRPRTLCEGVGVFAPLCGVFCSALRTDIHAASSKRAPNVARPIDPGSQAAR